MAKANGSIKTEQAAASAVEGALAVLIDGRPTIVEEVPFDDEGDAGEAPAAAADETLVFLCRELQKRARATGDETLAWLLEAAYKRARGGRR